MDSTTTLLILDNLTFNFNSLLGIVYGSFSMQFPMVEKCDFDRQFLSLRFKKSIIEKLNNCSFVLCKNLMHNSLLNFHSVFFRHPVV